MTGSGSVLAPTLRVINQLEHEGLIQNYAIGGSLAVIVYCEPFHTDDLDIFCQIPGKSVLIDLSPIYKRLTELGFTPDGLGIRIHGVKVEFLPPTGQLAEEAIQKAVGIMIEGVPTRVFTFEHALAVKAQAGRPKDWAHIATAVDSGEPDMDKLIEILERYELFEAWKKRAIRIA